MFVPFRAWRNKRNKTEQKSAFFEVVVTIFVTFVKDQGVQRMFTPAL